MQITGYSRDEMLGMNNRRIVDDPNNKKVFNTFHKVYLTGVPSHAFDWECIRKDGSRRFVEVSVTLKRDIHGKPADHHDGGRPETPQPIGEGRSEMRIRLPIGMTRKGRRTIWTSSFPTSRGAFTSKGFR